MEAGAEDAAAVAGMSVGAGVGGGSGAGEVCSVAERSACVGRAEVGRSVWTEGAVDAGDCGPEMPAAVVEARGAVGAVSCGDGALISEGCVC